MMRQMCRIESFSENEHEVNNVAGLEQPIDISDDDEAVAEIVISLWFRTCTLRSVDHGGDDDDSVEAALGL